MRLFKRIRLVVHSASDRPLRLVGLRASRLQAERVSRELASGDGKTAFTSAFPDLVASRTLGQTRYQRKLLSTPKLAWTSTVPEARDYALAPDRDVDRWPEPRGGDAAGRRAH
jgi:hypothetical protein